MDAREFNAWMIVKNGLHKIALHNDHYVCSACGWAFRHSWEARDCLCPCSNVEVTVRIRQEETELPERGIEL
jgi:DNA-directed RNA polymerase subunit RPC12/RpoP